MKTASRLLILTFLGCTFGAQAGPMGPSAVVAARLKKVPTSVWLAHYLPDDRYKIAGGVWKYVSTDLDTYYHRPDSPLMLRQSAERVIGFSSAADAEEAGYKPAPGLASQAEIKLLPGYAGGAGKAISKAEANYLLKFDGMLDAMSDSSWLPGQQGGSLGRFITNFQKKAKVFYNTPVPPRFANSGKKIKEGLDLLVSSGPKMQSGSNADREQVLRSGLTPFLQGMGEIIQTVGPENFTRYVSIKGMPALPKR